MSIKTVTGNELLSWKSKQLLVFADKDKKKTRQSKLFSAPSVIMWCVCKELFMWESKWLCVHTTYCPTSVPETESLFLFTHFCVIELPKWVNSYHVIKIEIRQCCQGLRRSSWGFQCKVVYIWCTKENGIEILMIKKGCLAIAAGTQTENKRNIKKTLQLVKNN